jgi:hypothetical protein
MTKLILLSLLLLNFSNNISAKTSPKPTEELYPNKIRTIDKILLDSEKENKENNKNLEICTFATDLGTKFVWDMKNLSLETSIIEKNSELSLAYKIGNNNFVYVDFYRHLDKEPNYSYRNIRKIELINNILYETNDISLKTQNTKKLFDFNKMKWYKDNNSYFIKCIEDD